MHRVVVEPALGDDRADQHRRPRLGGRVDQPVGAFVRRAGRTRASAPDPRADSRSAAAPGTAAGRRPSALRAHLEHRRGIAVEVADALVHLGKGDASGGRSCRRFSDAAGFGNLCATATALAKAAVAARGNAAHEIARREQQPAAGPIDFRLSRNAADRRQRAPLRRRGSVRRDQRECPRRGRVRDPVDQLSGQRQSDGAADLHRRAAARVGQADHRGPPLFRLCPAGPEARPAHADLGQAGRQPDHHRRRQPGAVDRSPRRPDPGLLRHPDRQSVRLAGDRGRHPGAASATAI